MATFFEVNTKHSGRVLINADLVVGVVRRGHNDGCDLLFADGDPMIIQDSYERVMDAIIQMVGTVFRL